MIQILKISIKGMTGQGFNVFTHSGTSGWRAGKSSGTWPARSEKWWTTL